jgi:hypothetical protein
MMMRFALGRWVVTGGVATTVHALVWPYAVLILVATAVYRLLAECARRKTLVALVTHAPAGTIAIMAKGPGGPAMWVRVGGGLPDPDRGGVAWTMTAESHSVTSLR